MANKNQRKEHPFKVQSSRFKVKGQESKDAGGAGGYSAVAVNLEL
jgi:hypothetical protein